MDAPDDWVFAYGSNMHLADLRRWFDSHGLGRARLGRVHPALLPDHRLLFDYHSPSRDGGAANVEPAAGREVPGLVLQVNSQALAGLDEKEGHPARYLRSKVPVRLLSGEKLLAWLYVVTPKYRRAHHVPPRRSYLALMLEVAKERGFPESYLAELRTTECAEDEPRPYGGAEPLEEAALPASARSGKGRGG